MGKILSNDELEKFIQEFLSNYNEEVFSVIITVDEENTSYIVNGSNRYDIEYDLVKKYL